MNLIKRKSRTASTVNFFRESFFSVLVPRKYMLWSLVVPLGAGSLALAGFAYTNKRNLLLAYAAAAQENSTLERSSDGKIKLNIAVRTDLPTYRIDEVKKHGRGAERIWVTCQCGVYDITDFVEGHPGGNKILMAAGDSIEPFWHLYQQHENVETLEILEELRIGNLDSRDIVVSEIPNSTDDFYQYEPKRHPALVIHSEKPFNAETPTELLLDHFYTPNPLFFVRNHLPVPKA